MASFTLLAIGKMGSGPYAQAFAEYQKRLGSSLHFREIDIRERNPALLQQKESQALLEAAGKGALLIALDGRGKQLNSEAFAKQINAWLENESRHLTFLIGGADGHTEELLKKADFMLSFGTMTWPHMLARVMLVEQLYRARQITAGHPYHRA